MREDFGRYVGFDAKEFKKSGIAGLLLKSLFRKNNHCYGFNKDAVLLCKNPQILTSRSLDQLQSLQSQLSSSKGAVGKLISATLEASDTISREDGFKSLETYVNEHSIKTTDESIFIPYRYLVPINAVFNRSIQNLSSYYTDIGLIWIFVFVLVVATALYAMGSINKKLLLLTVSVGI